MDTNMVRRSSAEELPCQGLPTEKPHLDAHGEITAIGQRNITYMTLGEGVTDHSQERDTTFALSTPVVG